jgi:hypothetical protein
MIGALVLIGTGAACILASGWFASINRWMLGWPRTDRGLKVGAWVYRAFGALVIVIGLAAGS